MDASQHFRSAKLVILDACDNVLVLKRSKTHPTMPRMRDLPGGIIEEGETHEEGVLREVYEETGWQIEKAVLQKVFEKTYERGERSLTRQLFLIRLDAPPRDVRLSWEHESYTWLPLKDLHDLEEPWQEAVDQI